MAVLNTWARDNEPTEKRYAFLQCDGCFPPRLAHGTEETLRAFGWRFEALDRGGHRCPSCPPRGRRPPPPSARHAHPSLPNLLIVGAAKCGTTSLHRYLSAHPEIQMPEAKELRFFQDPRCLEHLDRYATFFDATSPVRGEATPAYSCYPLLPGVPERIREAIPRAKLIYLVRDPVERAIAAYAEARANDKEPRSPERALGAPTDRWNAYLAQSRYAMQVERYLHAFPREQLLVVHQRELLANRTETLRRVFRFLGVDQSFISGQFEELANTRQAKRQRNRLGRALRYSRLAPVADRIPPRVRAALLRPIRGLTSRPIEVAVSAGVRERLERELGGEFDRVEQMVGPISASPSGGTGPMPR